MAAARRFTVRELGAGPTAPLLCTPPCARRYAAANASATGGVNLFDVLVHVDVEWRWCFLFRGAGPLSTPGCMAFCSPPHRSAMARTHWAGPGMPDPTGTGRRSLHYLPEIAKLIAVLAIRGRHQPLDQLPPDIDHSGGVSHHHNDERTTPASLGDTPTRCFLERQRLDNERAGAHPGSPSPIASRRGRFGRYCQRPEVPHPQSGPQVP